MTSTADLGDSEPGDGSEPRFRADGSHSYSGDSMILPRRSGDGEERRIGWGKKEAKEREREGGGCVRVRVRVQKKQTNKKSK
jgi:hypothetical protein